MLALEAETAERCGRIGSVRNVTSQPVPFDFARIRWIHVGLMIGMFTSSMLLAEDPQTIDEHETFAVELSERGKRQAMLGDELTAQPAADEDPQAEASGEPMGGRGQRTDSIASRSVE